MKNKKMQTAVKVVAVVAATLALTALWNASTLVSLSRPMVIQLLHSTTADAATIPSEEEIRYSRLGIEVPVKEYPNTSPLILANWDTLRSALKEGAALTYQGTDFSTSHLSFLTAHSSDSYPHQYSSAFAGLGQAKIGDQFTFYRQGVAYTYKVVDKKELDPSDSKGFAALAPEEGGADRLVLVTCWPVFTTNHRLVIVGERLPA